MNRYEFVQHLQGLDVVRAKKEIETAKKRPVEDRMRAIVDYHIVHNPLYKEKLKGRESGRFEDLPIMKKNDYQKPLDKIISDEYSLRDLYVGETSGSSGHPLYYAKNKESHAMTHATIERLYSEHGLAVCDKQARFFGIQLMGKSRYVELLKDLLLNRVRFPIFDLSDNVLERIVDRFRKKEFKYIYGYTSAIVLFSKYLLKCGLTIKTICPTIKKCIVTSETCMTEDRSVIEKAMGVDVINEYGCSEVGLVAFEDNKGIWRLVEDDCYVEIVDAEGNVLPEGQEGRILVTNLSNKALPFIRYEVGDVGVITHDEKGKILQKLTGRVSDIIKLPSGKVAGGISFGYIARSILEEGSLIREFIVRQTKLDTFEFDIVCEKNIDQDVRLKLVKMTEEYLEPNLNVVINLVDHIDRTASGKISYFYSELK